MDFTPAFFVDDDGSEPVLEWLRGLPGYKRRAAVAAIEEVLAHHGPGVCATHWGKWVKGVRGIFELRVRFDYGTVMRTAGADIPEDAACDAAERHGDILLRVFCHAYGDRVVLLLAGYDKGEDDSEKRQNKEAKLAESRLGRWQRRERAAAKQAARRGGSGKQSKSSGKSSRKRRS